MYRPVWIRDWTITSVTISDPSTHFCCSVCLSNKETGLPHWLPVCFQLSSIRPPHCHSRAAEAAVRAADSRAARLGGSGPDTQWMLEQQNTAFTHHHCWIEMHYEYVVCD